MGCSCLNSKERSSIKVNKKEIEHSLNSSLKQREYIENQRNVEILNSNNNNNINACPTNLLLEIKKQNPNDNIKDINGSNIIPKFNDNIDIKNQGIIQNINNQQNQSL